MAKPTVQAVIFDLFHTLVNPEDFTPDGFGYRDELVRLLGADRDHFLRYWQDGYQERETTPVDLVDQVERYQRLVGRPSLTESERRQADRWFGVGKDAALLNPKPELVELAREVGERCPVGVLSNCHERETRVWPESPLAPLVSMFVRSCDVGVMKPETEIYRRILAGLGLDAGHCIFVGNGGGEELVGARRAGFGTVIHMNGFDGVNGIIQPDEQARRAGQADVSVESVSALRTSILELL